MSSKISEVFVDTDVFGLHLYYCFKTGHNVQVRVNNSEATIPISKEEFDDIKKQIRGNHEKDL